jgi:hypothetical protein
MIEKLLNERLDMVVGLRVDQDVAAYPRSPLRQPHVDRLPVVGVRPSLQGNPFRLPRILAARR